MSILVIAERDHDHLQAGTLSVITAAKQWLDTAGASQLDVVIIGNEQDDCIKHVATLKDVNQVICLPPEQFQPVLAEALAPALVDIAQSYQAIFAPSTTFGKNLLPRVAALLDVQMISDITAITSATSFERPIYAGNAIEHVENTQEILIATVRTTAFDKAVVGTADGNNADITSAPVTAAAVASQFVRQERVESERPELTSADVVISGGRGMQDAEHFHLLETLADILGGAVGASRAAVDAGFVPNDYQVGQTGKIVAPQLYIAVGISGAVQHLAGMKDSKVIVAINKDEEAPIFDVADYGLVADLFEAVPQLIEQLKTIKS